MSWEGSCWTKNLFCILQLRLIWAEIDPGPLRIHTTFLDGAHLTHSSSLRASLQTQKASPICDAAMFLWHIPLRWVKLQASCGESWWEALRLNGALERKGLLEESFPALAGWPLTSTHLQLQLSVSLESTRSGHHRGRQQSGKREQRTHELPSTQQDWAAASPSSLLLGYPGLTQIWRPQMRHGSSSSYVNTLPPFISFPFFPLFHAS